MDLLTEYGSDDSSSGDIPDSGQPVATNGIGPEENAPGKLDEPGISPSSPKVDHVGQKSRAGESGNCPAVTSGGTSNSATTDGGMPCDMPPRSETKPTEPKDDPGAAETQSIAGAGAMALPPEGDSERGEKRADHTGGEAPQVNGAPDPALSSAVDGGKVKDDKAPMEDASSNLESTVSDVPAKLPPRGKTLAKLEIDSAADEDQSAAMGEGKLNHSGDEDSQMNGAAASSTDNDPSGDGQNAAEASAEAGSVAALRGTEVPSQKKTFDQVEYSSAYQKEGASTENDPTASVKPAPPALPLDDARNNDTKRDENEASLPASSTEEHSHKNVFLNVKKDPGYKAILFAQFKKLGLGSKVEESVLKEVFDELKGRGGRIFKLIRHSSTNYEEADDEAALKAIQYHFRTRNSWRRHWHDPNATEQNSASFVATVDESGHPIESTTNDVFLSLHNPTYKATMHAAFQQLGPGNNVPEEALTEVFHQFKGGGGRFFRQMHQRPEFQEVDDDIAMQAMRDHIRRRDGSIPRWNGAPSPEDREEIEYSANDVFLNLNKDPGYKALMFEQFKKLGLGQRVPDERVVNEVFQALKKRGGRFFRVTHASHDIHDEIGDEAALEIIKKHMQYRNRTSEEWYDPNTAAKYSEKDAFLNMTKDPEYRTLMYARFKEMGRGNDSDESRVQEVLQALKKRGGRIFKVVHASHDIHDEVGDEAALEIMRSHMKRRNATSKDWLDPIEYNPDDIFLNMKKDPEYKALMFAHFKKLGLGSKVPEENVVIDVFQALKARGGRFLKLIPHSSTAYEEANEAAALKTIRGHFQQRNTSRQHWHDPNATEQNSDYTPNDAFLNVNKDPEYKALMFAQFKKLGLGSKVDESAVNEVLQALKNRGGRFFKVVPYHNSYEEVDEAAALTAIRGHMGRRNQCSDQWYGDNEKTPASFAPAVDSTKKLPTEVVSLLDDDEMLHFGSRPGRKRQKPQSFMDAQGQDMLVREELARRWRAYSKKGRKGANDSNPFSPNEIRAFEQGCTAHGWGSWEFVVNEFLPERTVEECEQLASIIMELQPEMRERLLGEHNVIWVHKGLKGSHSQADELKSPSSSGTAQPAKKKAAAASSKKKGKRPPNGLSPVGADPCEDLGVGWTKKKVARKNAKDGATKEDKYYFSPEGKQFRSMAEARRYLDGENENAGKKGSASARKGKSEEEKTAITSSSRGVAPSASKNAAAASPKKRAKRSTLEAEKLAETGAAAGNSNDVYLNVKKDPGYKAIMFAHFKEMGYAANVDDVITNEVLRTLKKRGGRIFKLPKGKSIYEEADDEGALKTIDWHFRNRKASYDEWGKDSASNVQVPIPRKKRHQSIPSQSQSKPKAAATTGTKAKRSKSASSAQPTIEMNATELAHPKAKRMKRDDAARESGVAQPVDTGNDAGRPKRQSALKARQYLQEHTSFDGSFDGDDDEGEAPDSAATQLESIITELDRETAQLLKDLPDHPSQEEFEEESAWRYHNPPFPKGSKQQLTAVREGTIPSMPAPTPPEQLQPLPSAPPLPQLPSTGHCDWSFDEESRVLLADFTRGGDAEKIEVTSKDEEFLFLMMERDDLTVISDGLAESIDPTIWSRNYIEGCIGQDFHHKFRGFEAAQEGDIDQQPNGQPKEKEGWYSMKVADYFRYLDQRQSVKETKSDGAEMKAETAPNKEFTFVDSDGDKKSVNVDKESLYMIDVDLPKLLPRAFEDLQRKFKLPEILPGGSHCMMNAINANGRPFMGPNLYITPPCSFTHFHQDGHGTVDSGHLCLSGYNEVVMLRRLTERHKCHALNLLTGTSEPHNTLYGLPHRDDLGTQPGWPSKAAIEKCKSMQYYPSVFVLKPGQLVHINKGRLHAFRKLAPVPLRPTDCHADLRQEVLTELEREGVKTEVLCFSVAWDWMYKGVTSEGINREVSGILECARMNREHDLQSLAIPETSLVFLAKENIAKHQQAFNADESRALFSIGKSRHQTPKAVTSEPDADTSEPDAKTVLRGILPSLQYVVNRHNSSVKFSMEWAVKTKRVRNSWRVSIDSKPNTWQNPESFALDPYGAGDMKCKFCNEELSNVYMHCDGCEKLLNKDFNICSTCHRKGRYKEKVLMHPFNEKAHSILNHTGNPKESRRSRCPCRNGKECAYCGFCTGCSCKCHQWFTLHYRFMSLEAELDVLEQAESIVGADVLAQSNETKARLFSLISDNTPGEEPQSNNAAICQVIESKPAPAADAVPSNIVQKEAAISVEETQLDTKPAALPNGNEEAKDDGEQASVSFHCTRCGEDFTYKHAKVAPAAFKNHTTACKKKHEEMEAAGGGSPGVEARANDDVPQSTSAHIDPDQVECGDRVIVADDRGKPWQATILERHERLGQDGFRIHWDGTKKEKVDWVECTSIVNFIPGDAGGGSPDAEAGDSDDEPLISHRSW